MVLEALKNTEKIALTLERMKVKISIKVEVGLVANGFTLTG